MNKFTLGIVIPTYKEKENIKKLLPEIKQEVTKNSIKTLILVMDDNSPDGTAQVVEDLKKELSSRDFEVRLKVRPRKMGLASAYKQGFAEIKSEVDYLLSIDADLSHKPKYIIDFLNQAKNGSDLVIGSRYVTEGGIEGWSLLRKFISLGGSLYSKIILRVPINDFTGGFNLYKSSIFDSFSIESINAQGYLFQIEMKYKIAKAGFKFKEIPIIFVDRTEGSSKMDKKIFLEAIFGVIKLAFDRK